MNKVLDNSKRAKNAIIAFYIVAGVYAIALISDYMEYQLLNESIIQIINKGDANDARQAMVGVINLAASIVLIVLFIQWFRRAYHNLHKAKVKGLTTSEGWAAGAWFVPILNLFRPYQIMKEIAVETAKYNKDNGGDSSADSEIPAGSGSLVQTVGIWWALWIISSISSNISFQISRNAASPSELQNSTMASMIGLLTGIVAVFVIVKIIKESQKDQDKFIEVWNNVQDGKSGEGSLDISESDEILD